MAELNGINSNLKPDNESSCTTYKNSISSSSNFLNVLDEINNFQNENTESIEKIKSVIDEFGVNNLISSIKNHNMQIFVKDNENKPAKIENYQIQINIISDKQNQEDLNQNSTSIDPMEILANMNKIMHNLEQI